MSVVIIGGCGRVGLPLGLALASRGLSVILFDLAEQVVRSVNSGRMPFAEEGADALLGHLISDGKLRATTDPSSVSGAETVIVVVGTPIDEHLNPDLDAVPMAIEACAQFLRADQLIVLRSTVYPGGTALTEQLLERLGLGEADVAFCPERIAEGKALTEVFVLPQIVAGRTPRAIERAEKLFRTLTSEIIVLTPEEAELAKLFANTWRYVKFAAANQLWMMANDAGLDYERIRHAIRHEYPRAADLPAPGFVAGPCLFKDTMQLVAFNRNFTLGYSSMLINEGLPSYVVERLEQRFDLVSLTVGVLGMAFKGGSDDPRGSLAYKLRKQLARRAARVLCTDPFITDERFLPLETVLEQADLLIIAAPHDQYRELDTNRPLVDIWGLTGQGVLI